jgi:hypothetical protein
MRGRRGIGRTEVLIGVAVVAVLGLIAIPLVLSGNKSSARAEVPMFVDSIREFEIAYQGPFGDYVSADPAPRKPHEVDQNAVPWVSNAGFDKISWSPVEKFETEQVYGSYRVAAGPDGFKVTGTCDVDGDGERAEWVATEREGAKATTAGNVY